MANYLLLLLRLLAHLIYPFLSWAFLLRYKSALVSLDVRGRRAQTTYTKKDRLTLLNQASQNEELALVAIMMIV